MDEANDAPSPWDFQPVYEFLQAFRSPDASPSPPTPIAHSVPDLKPYVPKSLGDFSRIFETLSLPVDIPPRLQNESADSHSPPSSYDSEATPPSSAPDTEHFDDYISKTAKGVKWKDEVNGRDLTESRRRSTRSTATIDPSVIVQLLDGRSELSAPLVPASVTTSAKSQRHIRPPSRIPLISVDRTVIQPLYTLIASEQKAKLVKKLLRKFGPEPGSLLKSDPTLPLLPSGNTSPDGIHVFVDCSNIIIGFYNRIKASRGLHEKAHIKTPPMSYHSLALILERGRPVARRILVGSTSRSLFGEEHKLPNYLTEARKFGYELNILERVCKPQRSDSTPKKKRGAGSGYATSGQSSGSEGMALARPVMAEQAVDEILHMKLLESLVDTSTPSTIVLASGDAAEAEYSGGFLKNVERALLKGWKVELVAWHDGLSYEYRSKDFQRKWEGKFKVIELDDFCEELLAVYVQPYL